MPNCFLKLVEKWDSVLNAPMIGVSVIEKGTQNGVMTDADGQYAITVKARAVLEYSYIGYLAVEKNAINGTININMEPDNEMLEETVVVGYGVQKRSSLTGSVSQVKSQDVEARTITNASQALQGKTSGVQVLTSSARPGASPSIRIRGVGSNGSSDPLVVVDGRIGSLAGIDPNDIESMEVLKDGASAAIYGAEAGNGVILVTTKKGKGDGKITYDYQYTSQNLARVPQMMNAEQYIDYYSEAGLISLENFYNNWDFETNTDWTKVGFENSVMQRHNLTFSAGDANRSLYVSGSYLNTVISATSNVASGTNSLTINLATDGVTAAYDPNTWSNVYSGTGNYLALDIYSADGYLHEGTYTACATGGAIGEGEFGIGWDPGDLWGIGMVFENWGTCWWTVEDGVTSAEKVVDGTLTVELDGDVYTISLESSLVNAQYIGTLTL